MGTQEVNLYIFCPACHAKYEYNPEMVCPACGYELVALPFGYDDTEEQPRHPERYLSGLLEVVSFIPYFESCPRIETDTRTRPERMLPPEVRQFMRVLFTSDVAVEDFALKIREYAKRNPKEKFDPFSLDILGLRSLLTLIFCRERDLGLVSIAEAVRTGSLTLILVRLQHLLMASGLLHSRNMKQKD